MKNALEYSSPEHMQADVESLFTEYAVRLRERFPHRTIRNAMMPTLRGKEIEWLHRPGLRRPTWRKK